MTVSSHYSKTNAQIGLLNYQGLLLSLEELSILKEKGSKDYPIKLNRIKKRINKLREVHTTDSVKNIFNYDINFKFAEEVVQEIENSLIDVSGLGKKIFPVLDDIRSLFPRHYN